MDEDLIDRIYECAFVPEQWVGVLDAISADTDVRGGMFYSVSPWQYNWVSSETMRDLIVSVDAMRQSAFMGTLFANPHGGFLREYDLFTKEEWAKDYMFRDVLGPAGLGMGAGTVITAPTGDNLIMAFQQAFEKGPLSDASVTHLDALRPHLARSMLTSARLQLERARVAAATLEMLGLPALVFDGSGTVMAANPLIEALDGYLHWRARDRVTLVDRKADALFQQVVELGEATGAAPTRSFAVHAHAGQTSMVGHIVPIRLSARDIFARSAGVLILTPVTHAEAPPVELIQSLFDLTPAEARVARSLTKGDNVEQIAADSGVSLSTVRTQVRGVLEKTGCHRQAEVVSLLGGLAIPGSANAADTLAP